MSMEKLVIRKKLLCRSATRFLGAERLSQALWQNGHFLFPLSWLRGELYPPHWWVFNTWKYSHYPQQISGWLWWRPEVITRYNEKWLLCSLWNKVHFGKRFHTHLSVRTVFPSLFTAAESYCAVSLPHCDTVLGFTVHALVFSPSEIV